MIAPTFDKSTTSNPSRRRKTVSWDTVEIREYEVVLSTNPATKYGPPIELGWEYCWADSVELLAHDEDAGTIAIQPHLIEGGRTTVDLYESIRPSDQRHHQVMREMYWNSFEREALLQEKYTEEEIKQAVEEKLVISRARARSKLFLTTWTRNKPKRIRKIKRAVKNLRQKQIPNSIYAMWWLPLEVSF